MSIDNVAAEVAADRRLAEQREIQKKRDSTMLAHDLDFFMLASRPISGASIQFATDNPDIWLNILIKKFSNHPRAFLNIISNFPQELQKNLQRFSAVFRFLAITREPLTSQFIQTLIFHAKKAYMIYSNPHGTTSGHKGCHPFLNALTQFYGSLEALDSPQLTEEQILILQMMMHQYNQGQLGVKHIILDQLSQVLVASRNVSPSRIMPLSAVEEEDKTYESRSYAVMPMSSYQRGFIFKSYHEKLASLKIDVAPNKWPGICEVLFDYAIWDDQFLLFMINARESLPERNLVQVEKLSLLLTQIDENIVEITEMERLEGGVRLMNMGNAAAQMAPSQKIVFEAIAAFVTNQIWEETYREKNIMLESFYSEEGEEKAGKITMELIEWRGLIQRIVFEEIGRLAIKKMLGNHVQDHAQRSSVIENNTTFWSYGSTGRVLSMSMSLQQMLNYLSLNQALLRYEDIKTHCLLAFSLIDQRVNQRSKHFFPSGIRSLERLHSVLAASPELLSLYFEYAVSAQDTSVVIKRSFFHTGTPVMLRFVTLEAMKKEVIFLIDHLYILETKRDVSVAKYTKLIFGFCKKIEEATGESGEFMAAQFCRLLDEQTRCPDNIRLILLRPFRFWLDRHNVSRMYYEHEGSVITRLGYADRE